MAERDWSLPDDVEPLGARYTALLEVLHADMVKMADAHEPHGEGNGDWCSPDGSTVCDELGEALFERMNTAVSRDDVPSWLEDGPADLLDWHADLQGDTPRDTIVLAIHYDLSQRLLNPENGWPRA